MTNVVVAVSEKSPKFQREMVEENLVNLSIKNFQPSRGLIEKNWKSFYLVEKKNFLATVEEEKLKDRWRIGVLQKVVKWLEENQTDGRWLCGWDRNFVYYWGKVNKIR